MTKEAKSYSLFAYQGGSQGGPISIMSNDLVGPGVVPLLNQLTRGNQRSSTCGYVWGTIIIAYRYNRKNKRKRTCTVADMHDLKILHRRLSNSTVEVKHIGLCVYKHTSWRPSLRSSYSAWVQLDNLALPTLGVFFIYKQRLRFTVSSLWCHSKQSWKHTRAWSHKTLLMQAETS